MTQIQQCSQHKHKNSQAKHDSLWLIITVAGESEAGGFLGFTGQWMSSRFNERFALKKNELDRDKEKYLPLTSELSIHVQMHFAS